MSCDGLRGRQGKLYADPAAPAGGGMLAAAFLRQPFDRGLQYGGFDSRQPAGFPALFDAGQGRYRLGCLKEAAGPAQCRQFLVRSFPERGVLPADVPALFPFVQYELPGIDAGKGARGRTLALR